MHILVNVSYMIARAQKNKFIITICVLSLVYYLSSPAAAAEAKVNTRKYFFSQRLFVAFVYELRAQQTFINCVWCVFYIYI